jgi:lipopolysaccharide transport system ATP-binding protein
VAQPAIEIEGLSKVYRVGTAAPHRSIIDAAGDWWKQAVGRSGSGVREFWALRDISLGVRQGEAVGLIGHNGAGKSTLLKILSRITEPTTGQLTYRGRIGSLLEVGTGFHPQLSGRDNIYLSGAILGMRRNEIAQKFDQIVDFSGVEAFLDEPIKHYSSGMYLRLAFAVAAHLETDILLIDEVLAVGDAAFQKKCLARMSDVAHAGRTVVFVSHNLTAVQALCQRAIWLDHGKIAADGAASGVISNYLRKSSGFGSQTDRHWDSGMGPAGGGVELRKASVFPAGGRPEDPIDVKTPFCVEFEFAVAETTQPTALGLQLVDEQGTLIFDVGSGKPAAPFEAGSSKIRCKIPGDLLNNGSYRLGVTLHQQGRVVLQCPEFASLDILDSETDRAGWFGNWPGAIRPRFQWDQISEPHHDH